jgi:hypothetical protein
MAMDGMGTYQIARKFTDEMIVRPSTHIARMTGIASGKTEISHIKWTDATINKIIHRPEYMGHTVNFRTYKTSFKSKKHKHNLPEKWGIFENTRDSIIDPLTWETKQKCRTVKHRTHSDREANPLTGLLFCVDCNDKMHNRRSDYTTDKNGGKIHPVDTYECTTYRNNAEKFVYKCSIHFIRTSAVRELVIETIRRTCGYVRESEVEFVAKLRADSEIQQAAAAKSHERQIAKNEKRIAELERLLIRIYEDTRSANSLMNGSVRCRRRMTRSKPT